MVSPVKPTPAVVQEVLVATTGGNNHCLLAPDPRLTGEDQSSGQWDISIVRQSLLQTEIFSI